MPDAERPYVDRPVVDLEAARTAARTSAIEWGLGEPELMRRGMNALFVAGEAVVRVGHATAHPRLGQELASALIGHGVPTVTPLDGLAAIVDDLAVSAWQRVPASDSPVDWAAIGAAVRRVHELAPRVVPEGYPTPSPRAFPWWRFDALLTEAAGAIDAAALAGLTAAVERHRSWGHDIEAGAVLCHGDVHPGNVLAAPTDSLLLDWDLMCVAAPAWDHAMLTTYAERWGGDPSVYSAFAEGYGGSFADDDLTRAVAELRNVAATLMRVRAGLTDPTAAVEAERRLRYWRGDPEAPVWRAQ